MSRLTRCRNCHLRVPKTWFTTRAYACDDTKETCKICRRKGTRYIPREETRTRTPYRPPLADRLLRFRGRKEREAYARRGAPLFGRPYVKNANGYVMGVGGKYNGDRG